MKSYTDLEQSRKLAKILPIESADMWWVALNWQETEYYVEVKQDGINQPKKAIPCWSLAALLDILQYPTLFQNGDKEWGCTVWIDTTKPYSISPKNNPVDVCVDMIIKLKENELI